jgi:predicted transcriptional regulator
VSRLDERAVPWGDCCGLYHFGTDWYHEVMATNLRLRADAATALQEHAESTGMSQQEIIRRAIDAYLERETGHPTSEVGARAESRGGGPPGILPPRQPFLVAERLIELPADVTSADLLDRGDRI